MARGIDIDATRSIIVAPATASGVGAIAIVRLSGEGSVALAEKVFSRRLSALPPGQLALGTLSNHDGNAIDQGLGVHWQGPRSYTGEDMVEFHLHGSPAVVTRVQDACVSAGARLASPGEFTRRAYLNDKLDLAQAEAVSSLTSAQTEAAGRQALRQLSGGLSERLYAMRRDLIQVTAELEASVDYPDEGIPPVTKDRLLQLVDHSRKGIDSLLESYQRGHRLQEGATVVLAGAPNAGKSSLFNSLIRRERAIVTPHPGTTRDTIEATIDLRGIPLTLVDTAGLRQEAEEIEAMGIERSRELIRSADLALFVVDPTEPLDEPLQEYRALSDLPHVLLINKSDLLRSPGNHDIAKTFIGNGRQGVYTVSATTRDGVAEVEEALIHHLSAEATSGMDVMITSMRHRNSLAQAYEALGTALEGIASELSPELVIIDLTLALSQLDQITGKTELDEEVLDAIFFTFCLGK